MPETDENVREKPPEPVDRPPPVTTFTEHLERSTTTTVDTREKEKSLYEPKVEDNKITTFDGRTFTQTDPTKNEWEVQADGKSVSVQNLKLHPDKTLTYGLNGLEVAELPNGQKLVTKDGTTVAFDQHGREMGHVSNPAQFLDKLRSAIKPEATALAEGDRVGARDNISQTQDGSARPPARVRGGGEFVGAYDTQPVGNGTSDAIPTIGSAARNPDVFSSDPNAPDSKTFKSAQALMPELVAGMKDNNRPEDALTRNYFDATTPEARQRALTDLQEMARNSSDPLVQRRALDMQLLDKSLLAKSASDLLGKAEANGGEKEKQDARNQLTEALKDVAKMAQPSGLNPEGIGKAGNTDHYLKEDASKVLDSFRTNGRGAEVNDAVARAQNDTAALPGRSFAEMHRFVSNQPNPDQRMSARETAVKELEALNKASGRDELGDQLRTLKPLKAMLDMQDTQDPKQASARLGELREMEAGGNKDAAKYLEHLTKKLGGPEELAKLEAALSKDGPDGVKALNDLKTKGLAGDDSPATTKLNELKTEDITRGLTLKSSEADLKTAKEKLDREVAGGNKQAIDSARLLDVATKLKEMEDPARAPKAMQDLIAMSKPDGDKAANPHAREALASVLLSGNNKGAEGFRNILNENGDRHKPILTPDLSRLTQEQSDAIKTDAVKALREGIKSGQPISTHEAAALGLTLADTVRRSNVENPLAKEIRGTFEDIFDKKVDKDNRAETADQASATTNALNGLFRSITHGGETGTHASRMVAYEYLRGASSEHNQRLGDGNIGKEFKDHVQAFKDLAAKGNPDAMAVLAGFAGGAGRHNHTAGFRDELAKSARDTIVKIATDQPHMRDGIMDALTKFPQTLLADQSHRRETLGMVAGLGPSVPEHVRENLRTGLALSGPARESAINGMIALGDKLNSADIKAMTENLTPQLRTALERNKDKFSPEVGKELTTQMANAALDKTRPADERIRALEVVSAVGPKHITPETITALRQLGSESGRQRLAQDYEKSYHDADEKKQVQDNIGKIQRGAADALLSVAENASDPSRKMQAFLTFANTDWGLAKAPDRADWSHRLNALQDKNPDNVIIHAVAPQIMHRLSLDERSIPPQSTEAARLAASFYNRGAKDVPDQALLAMTKGAIENYGANTVKAVADRLTMFNSLPPEMRRDLTKFTGKLEDGKSLSLEGRTVDAKTFNALPADVRKELFGSSDKMAEPERLNLEGKRISAGTFNALPPDVRKYINGTGVMGKDTEVPAEALKGKSLDAATFNSLSDSLKRSLNGSTKSLSEGYSVPDLAGKVIPNANFNKLSPDLKRALTGSDQELGTGEKFSLTGRTLDADVFNRLPADVRKTIRGTEGEMTAGTQLKGDQLNGKELTGEQFNSLSPDLRRQLTGSAAERTNADPPVSLSGKSIEASTFNRLPEELREHLGGTTEFMQPGRVIKDLSNATIDAASFNALTPEQRGQLSGTDKPLDATTVLAHMNNRTISERDSLSRNLLDSSFEDRVNKIERDAKLELDNAKKELADLEKFKKEAIEHLSKHSEDGVGWFKKLSSYVGLSDAQRQFIDKQEGQLFSIAAFEQVTKQQERKVQEAAGRVQLLDIANTNRDFQRLNSEGRLHQADHLAVDLVARHGRAGLALAPDIARAFQKTGEGANANPLARLHTLGETQHRELRFNPDVGDTEGVRTGLNMLRGIEKRNHPDGQPFRDAAITRNEALAGIDQHPTVRRLQGISQAVSDQLQVLTAQVQTAGRNGDKFDEFIKDAQQRAGSIKELLGSVTAQDVKDLREAKQTIDKELKDGKISDPESRKELEKRSKAMDDMLRLFDKDYKMPDESDKIAALRERLGKVSTGFEEIGGPSSKERDKILEDLRTLHAGSPRQQVDKLLSKLETPEFKSVTDFQNWLAKDGVVLGAATAAAVIATAAIVFSGGTATPLVLAAAATAAGMVAADSALELQRYSGMRSDGSRIGRYARGEQVANQDGSTRNMHLGWDVALPYTGEFIAGTAIGWASGGVGAKLGEAFSKMTPAAKAAFVAENKGALDALGRNVARLDALAAKSPGFAGFMRVLGQEAKTQGLFTGASVLAEKGVHEGAKAAGVHLEEGNKLTSFFIGVGLSAMHRGFTARVPSGPMRSGPNGENLRMQFQSKGAAHENNYIQSAERRGSKVTMTRDGFVETTKHGLRVEWSRAAGEPGTTTGGTSGRPGPIETTTKPSFRIEPITDANATPGRGRSDARTTADTRTAHSTGDPAATPAASNPHDPSFTDLTRKVQTERQLHDLNQREAELTRRQSEPNFSDPHGKVAQELRDIAQKKQTAQTEFDGIKLNGSTQKIFDQIKLEHQESTRAAKEAQDTLKATQDQIAREKAAERQRLDGQSEETIKAREKEIDARYKDKLQEQEATARNTGDKAKSVLEKGNVLSKFIQATDSFPPGEYMVTGNRDVPPNDRAGQPNHDHTGNTRGIKVIVPEGAPIPRKTVEQVLENINKLGLRPSEVELSTKLGARGEFTDYKNDPTFTRVRVRVGDTDQHFLGTHTHETGHLFDLKELYTKGATKTPREIDAEWRRHLVDPKEFPDIGDFTRNDSALTWVDNVLNNPSNPYHDRIKHLGKMAGLADNDYRGHRKLISDIYSEPVFNGSPNDTVENAKYMASRSELMAEMFMLHQEKSAALARGEKPMSYKELVDRFTKPRDQDRAGAPRRSETMIHFEEMYKFMEKHVFEPNALRDGAIARFQQQRGPLETGAVRDALRQHGPDSPEYTRAVDRAKAESLRRIQDAAIREVFARDHHLDPNFNPDHLPNGQKAIYDQYQKLHNENFDPKTDQSVPPALRDQLADARGKVNKLEDHMRDFNNRRMEAMRDGLLRDHWRSFLSKQQPNFLNDINNAWQAGLKKAHENAGVFELATALGHDHKPRGNSPIEKTNIEKLQQDFKSRTGRDLDERTAREALTTAQNTPKPFDNNSIISRLSKSVKSPGEFKHVQEPTGKIDSPEALADWRKIQTRLDTIADLHKLHQINTARQAEGLPRLPFDQLLQVATAQKSITPEKARSLANYDALFKHLERKAIPHMDASAQRAQRPAAVR